MSGQPAKPSLVLTALVRETDKLVGQYEAREAHRAELAARVAAMEADVLVLTQADRALTALLEQTGAANLKAIEELVTSGLQAVFDDLALSFHFEVEATRGQQTLTPVIASHGVVEGPMLESHGGGPAQLVSLLLRMLTVHRLGLHPLIVLDESLNMVATQYIANCAQFLTGLCSRLGLTILLVTHHAAFTGEATRAYEIQGGAGGATFALVTP